MKKMNVALLAIVSLTAGAYALGQEDPNPAQTAPQDQKQERLERLESELQETQALLRQLLAGPPPGILIAEPPYGTTSADPQNNPHLPAGMAPPQESSVGDTNAAPLPLPERRRHSVAVARAGDSLAVIVGPVWEDPEVGEFMASEERPNYAETVRRLAPKVQRQEIDRNRGTINNTTINVVNSPGANVSTASGKVARSRSTMLPMRGGRRPHPARVKGRAHQVQGGCFTAGGMVAPSTYVAGGTLPGGLQRVEPYPDHAFNEKMKALARNQMYERALANYWEGRDVYDTSDYDAEEYYLEE